ncbi:MAG: hypothetical protein JW726_15960 [Anaerolineales bacterium]|nr:hypothetical protein [Anaerolineales bacterium]
MLEPPDLETELILACLQHDYSLQASDIIFLPLGADIHTAVFCAQASHGEKYFVKLRQSPISEVVVILPKFLSDQGMSQIIAPQITRDGQLWAELGIYKLILYPYIDGRSGFDVTLSESQWFDLGIALKHLHQTDLPGGIRRCVRQEIYSFLKGQA